MCDTTTFTLAPLVGKNRSGTRGIAPPGEAESKVPANDTEKGKVTWADVVRKGRAANNERNIDKIVSSALSRNNPVS
jgi:hypothetical protein